MKQCEYRDAALLEQEQRTLEEDCLLVEKDIELSIDELVKLKDLVVAKLQAVENGESAELTEEELEDVAGGVIPTLVFVGFLAFVFTNVALVANGHELRW